MHGFYDHLLMSPNFSYQWIYALLIVMGIRAAYIFRKESKKQKKQLFEGGFDEIKNSDVILVSFVSLFILCIALFLLLKI